MPFYMHIGGQGEPVKLATWLGIVGPRKARSKFGNLGILKAGGPFES